MKLFGLLVTFNRPIELRATLAVLADQVRTLDHLVVVDNGASPAAAEAVEAYGAGGLAATYIALSSNAGPAGGIASGLRWFLDHSTDDDWTVVLDDDDPPPARSAFTAVADLIQRAELEHPNVGAVGLAGARFRPSLGRLVRLPDDQLQGLVGVDYVGGSQLLAIRMRAVRDAGVFRDDFFFGFDDLEFALRMRRFGYSCVVDGDRWLQARIQQRTTPRRKPPLGYNTLAWRHYYSVRNLLVILRESGHVIGALVLTLRAGLANPLVGVVTGRPRSLTKLTMSLRGCVDGWTTRMGRRVEPFSR